MLIAIIILYLVSSLLFLNFPGLYADELLHAIPALYIMVNKPFYASTFGLELFGRAFPLLKMSYLGALKTYIFLPVFSIFGVSIASLRITTIFIGAAALFYLFKFLKEWTGNIKLACFVSLILALDPSYILFIRQDWGPVSLSMLLKALTLYLGIKWWRTKRLTYLIPASFVLGLGIYDKASFFIFAIALLISGFVVLRKSFIERLDFKTVSSGIISMLIGLSIYIVYNIQNNFESFSLLFKHMDKWGVMELHNAAPFILHKTKIFYKVTLDILSGITVPNIVLTNRLTMRTMLPVVFLITAAIYLTYTALYICKKVKHRHAYRKSSFVLAVLFFIYLQIVFLPYGLLGPHNVMLIYPFVHIFIGIVLVETVYFFKNKGLRQVRLIVVFVIAALIWSNTLVLKEYYSKIRNSNVKADWSKSIYTLSDIVESCDKKVACLDWGIDEGLRFASKGRINIIDTHLIYDNNDILRGKLLNMLNKNDTVYIMHPPQYTTFETPAIVFQDCIGAKIDQGEIIKEKKVYDGNNWMYTVYYK